MAFVNAWDPTTPTDAEDHKLGASRIRETKAALDERLAIDHSWDADAEDGKHNKVTLREQGVGPTPGAEEGSVYTKDVGGITELFYKDSGLKEQQLTTDGILNQALLKIGGEMSGAIVLDNLIGLWGRNAADDANINIGQISGVDAILLGDVSGELGLFGSDADGPYYNLTSQMWHSDNDGEDSGLDADLIRGEIPGDWLISDSQSSDPGGKGYCVIGGVFAVQWGSHSSGSDTTTVTMDLAFASTASYQIALTDGSSAGHNEVYATKTSATQFSMTRTGSGTRGTHWIAVGLV